MKTTKFVILITIFLAISILYSYSASSAQTQKVLGCEGDSQTAVRSTLVDSDTYCYKVAQALGWDHVNWSVGGSTSSDVAARLPGELASTHVDCLLVMIGANDAYISTSTYKDYPPEWIVPQPAHVSLVQFQSNLVTINNIANSAGVPWTYITPWSFWDSADMLQFRFYVDAARNTLAPLGVPFVDAFHLQQDRWWNYQNNTAAFYSIYETDYQHPTGAGHSLIANEFTQARNIFSCAYPNYVFQESTPIVTPTSTAIPIPTQTTIAPTSTANPIYTPTMECHQITEFNDGTRISLCRQ